MLTERREARSISAIQYDKGTFIRWYTGGDMLILTLAIRPLRRTPAFYREDRPVLFLETQPCSFETLSKDSLRIKTLLRRSLWEAVDHLDGENPQG